MLRPHRLRLTVLIFLLLATSASRGWGQSDQRIATVLVVTGVAEVRASGEATWDQLRFRDAIFARDTVRTAANSRVKFLMRDDAILTLGEDGEMEFTEFLLTQQQQRNVIDLFLGALKVVTVRILRSGSSTQVRTSNTVAGVRGTSFIVRFIPPNITEPRKTPCRSCWSRSTREGSTAQRASGAAARATCSGRPSTTERASM